MELTLLLPAVLLTSRLTGQQEAEDDHKERPHVLLLLSAVTPAPRTLQTAEAPRAPAEEKSMRSPTDGRSQKLSHQELEAEPRESSQGFKGQLAKLFPYFCMF